MNRLGLIAVGALACAAAMPAHAQRAHITPHIDASQVLVADLNGGDVLTYSTAGAGLDASMHTRRVEVEISYQYEHRFSYDKKKMGDDDVHSGLARVAAKVAPGVSLEAGGIATRARSDIRGDAVGSYAGNVRNVSQVYSAYAGPTVTEHVGPLNVGAAYRFGYTKVESPDGGTGVPAGQPPLDVYDSATMHQATASVGVKSGTVLPVGVTVSGAYEREDAHQLDQRYEGKYVRGDVVLPVGGAVALEGGVGYEKIQVSQRDALLNGSGQPVVDGAGREVTDPASPRRIAYDTDGLIWDAGVIYRPSPRTFLEARAGRRYGSMSYTGSLSYQIGPSSGIQIGVYDSIESFGRQLNGSIAALPNSFVTVDDPFGNPFGGCVFGTSGASAGSCLNGSLASTTTANYRARGIVGVLVLSRGPIRMGFGGGYANRKYIAPANAGSGFTIDGSSDDTYYGQFFASRELGRDTNLSGTAFVSYFDSDLPGAQGVLGWGANTALTRSFGRLGATASLGVFGSQQQRGTDEISGQALLGLHYGF